MSEVEIGLELALARALRPLVRELVAEELQRLHDRDEGHDRAEPAPYLTVAEYAERHRATPAAVRARIRRGSLHAIHPPGSREYLIPHGNPDGREATIDVAKSAPAMVEHPGARHRNNGGFDAD